MNDKIAKVISVFKKDGVKVAAGKAARYISTAFKKHMGIAYKIDFKKRCGEYEALIDRALSGGFDRVLIWRSSFGWNVPLYQRPQHISLAMSKKSCLVFYEVTSMTDRTKAIEKYSDNLYLVNFGNRNISGMLFSKLDKIDAPKYLQFYSTDWSMSLDYVKGFASRGYGILYEYIDDLNPRLAGTRELPKNVADKYNWVMESADNTLVVATADLLYSDVVTRRGKKNLVFAANGVDYDFFTDFSSPFEFEDEFKKVLNTGKPIVCYYGAMADWLDYELIKKIDSSGEYTVLLFGIRYDDSLDNSGILTLPNVHFMGPRDYKKLKYYASCADILTIPFKINEITLATSPLKLFEYMALKKPIVTSAMPECMKYSSVLTAHNHGEFFEQLKKCAALSKDASYLGLLDKEARENSWSAKADIICALLKEHESK